MHATVISSVSLLLAKFLDHNGYQSTPLYIEAGLDPHKLNDANARYPISKTQKLWRLAVALTDDSALGLKVASYWHPTTFHALGYAWLASGSIKEGLERLVRYSRIVNDEIIVNFEHRIGAYYVSFSYPQPDYRPEDVSIDFTAALVVTMTRTVYGDDVSPILVTLPRPKPTAANEFYRFFNCPIEYEADELSLHFLEEDIEKPLPTANAELAHTNDNVIRDYLVNLDRSQISMQVKVKLIDSLSSGVVTEQAIAEALHMSLRSLQRKLKEEEVSFKDILEETRKELASQYIKNSRLSLGEITFLLGFSEPANFTRAFKRWTGKAPSYYRSDL